MTIAGGIAAALFARERTGKASVVDISLVGTGLWAMGAGLTASMLAGGGGGGFSPAAGAAFINPLVGVYRAKGGGSAMLTMLQGHVYWADTVQHLGRPELAEDPRFATPEAFAEHSDEARAVLQEMFETATLEEWRERLAEMKGQWGPFQTLDQIPSDPQVQANGYLAEVDAGDGTTFGLVTNPVQFDEEPPVLRKGPEHAQHTEDVLLELGLDWDRIAELKGAGAIN
jgi:crotonobetainyl-CoA:carnitine CoA-transferase CaiB-like acyl-CoA transferase